MEARHVEHLIIGFGKAGKTLAARIAKNGGRGPASTPKSAIIDANSSPMNPAPRTATRRGSSGSESTPVLSRWAASLKPRGST